MINASGFQNRSADLSVTVEGGQSSTKIVCLDPNVEGRPQLHDRVVGLQRPRVRSDGWLEIEMGEFFNSGIENEEVQMNVIQTRGGNWKRGLILEGIEVRPKYNTINQHSLNYARGLGSWIAEQRLKFQHFFIK